MSKRKTFCGPRWTASSLKFGHSQSFLSMHRKCVLQGAAISRINKWNTNRGLFRASSTNLNPHSQILSIHVNRGASGTQPRKYLIIARSNHQRAKAQFIYPHWVLFLDRINMTVAQTKIEQVGNRPCLSWREIKLEDLSASLQHFTHDGARYEWRWRRRWHGWRWRRAS